jgi:hypothetical protein
MKEMEFTQNKLISKVVENEPLGHNVCIGDLLNHYGASQQVACPTSCRYVHYKDIVQDTSKQVVLQRFLGVAPKLSLTETTITLMTKKINSDSKFK